MNQSSGFNHQAILPVLYLQKYDKGSANITVGGKWLSSNI